MTDPLARGTVLVAARQHKEPLAALQRETFSILKAVKAEARPAQAVEGTEDFVVLLIEDGWDAKRLPLPDLKDRMGAVVAVAQDAAEGRLAVTRARRHLRDHGASLGARELVLSPEAFGYLGLESDGLREKLEILLQTLVLDAERLRLRREGWEEP